MEIAGAALGAVGNVVGGIVNNNAARQAANKAWDRQKRVLQNQIQWRVADTVAAGLHPLAALGVSPASGPAPSQVFDMGLGNAASDIGRAIDNARDPAAKLQHRITLAQVERAGLENELLRTQIASERMRLNQQSTPGIPVSAAETGLAPTNHNAGTIDVPGLGSWKVANKNLGQEMENAYSELGNIMVLPGLVHDMMNSENLATVWESLKPHLAKEDRWLIEQAIKYWPK